MDRKSAVDCHKGDDIYAGKRDTCVQLSVMPVASLYIQPHTPHGTAIGTYPTRYQSLEWRIHTHLHEGCNLEMQCNCFS